MHRDSWVSNIFVNRIPLYAEFPLYLLSKLFLQDLDCEVDHGDNPANVPQPFSIKQEKISSIESNSIESAARLSELKTAAARLDNIKKETKKEEQSFDCPDFR